MRDQSECILFPGTLVDNGKNYDNALKEVVEYLKSFGYTTDPGYLVGDGGSPLGLNLNNRICYDLDTPEEFVDTITMEEFKRRVVEGSPQDNYLTFN